VRSPFQSDGNRSPSSGGQKGWILLAIAALLVTWWFLYEPLRPESPLLPPTAGLTNRVPETLTNVAQTVRGLTNLVPTNLLTTLRPGPGGTNLPVMPTNTLPSPPAVTNLAMVKDPPPPVRPDAELRPPQNPFEVQLALDRLGISPGSLDGVTGSQTRAAIRAFQQREGLAQTGELNDPTRARLWIRPPVYTSYTVTTADLARLRPLSSTWLGKSQQDRLDYETILELAAEKGHAHPNYVRRLNPHMDWTNVMAGTALTIPYATPPPARQRAAHVRIRLAEKTLQAFDQNGRLLAHFPCSIARSVEKRPLGELRVVEAAEHPNYRFNPDIFPESVEGRRLGRPLMIPPGPNNPVGIAWIGLDRPGYGIHGTPSPEAVGRTESHGCFRLANWNADLLLKLVWKGMPVHVEP
jgi:lipoprotein-anchoring transpeptidase ErfK/SrfK